MSKTMVDLNCVVFTMEFNFDAKSFDGKKFRKLINLDAKLPLNVAVTANSERPNRAEHLHIDLDITDETGTLKLAFHPRPVEFETDDETGQNTIENRISEIASAFKNPKLTGYAYSRFQFSQEYTPTLFLGYPAQIDNERLKGAIVTGHELTVGKGKSKRTLFINLIDRTTTVLIFSNRTVDLSSFFVERLITKDADLAHSLVHETNVDSQA